MRIPGRYIDFWRAYFAVEPWPEERSELLNGLLCQSIHRDLTGETLELDTWLPKFDKTLAQRRKEEQEASLAAFDSLFEDGD